MGGGPHAHLYTKTHMCLLTGRKSVMVGSQVPYLVKEVR